MQIGMVALEEPSPGLSYRVDTGTIGQLEVRVIACQLRVPSWGAARPVRRGRRSCSLVVSDCPLPFVPARTPNAGEPPPHTQPR